MLGTRWAWVRAKGKERLTVVDTPESEGDSDLVKRVGSLLEWLLTSLGNLPPVDS
jgi:hypothetical protein